MSRYVNDTAENTWAWQLQETGSDGVSDGQISKQVSHSNPKSFK